jgi:predicted 3-demethylubiquinone-9 3-methyltransferase (glyoxalase superfamily)
VSFVVHCKGQQEVDYYRARLLEGGGQTRACGWLKDRFGLSWQIVSIEFFDLIRVKDPAARDRIMKAMLQIIKFDVAALKRASGGKPASGR